MVRTRATEADQITATVPEPALRPMDARFPNRYVVRRARVYVDHTGAQTMIVIRDPRGRERRIPAGPGGAARVVLERHSDAPGQFLGSLDLRDENGRVLARFPRLSWKPESWVDESVHLAGEAADDASAFAAATGLPVTGSSQTGSAGRPRRGTPVTRSEAAFTGRHKGGNVPVVSYGTVLPAWFLIARSLLSMVPAGVLIAFAVFDISHGTGKTLGHGFASTGTYRALALTWASAVLAQPLLAGVLFARAWWLDRAGTRALPAASAVLAPHPSGVTTRRFLRTASLRVFPGDLVVTEEGGEERWLPRSGPTGIAGLTRVTAKGKPDRLELRTADGRPRAVLPWEDWFAGVGGEEALAEFATGAGLPLGEVAASRAHQKPRANMAVQAGALWVGSGSGTLPALAGPARGSQPRHPGDHGGCGRDLQHRGSGGVRACGHGGSRISRAVVCAPPSSSPARPAGPARGNPVTALQDAGSAPPREGQ